MTASHVEPAGAKCRLHFMRVKIQELFTLAAHKVVRFTGASTNETDALRERKKRLQRADIRAVEPVKSEA